MGVIAGFAAELFFLIYNMKRHIVIFIDKYRVVQQKWSVVTLASIDRLDG